MTPDASRRRNLVSLAGARPLPAGDLFTVLWEALSDILGTAAAATLVRRSARRAAVAWPELHDLSVTRDTLDYHYTLPEGWNDPRHGVDALTGLAREIWVLLVELTGPVVVDRLARIPELRDQGIVPRREDRP